MTAFRVAIKESVFRETSLEKEKYGEDPQLTFDSRDEAQEWIDETNELLPGPGSLVLHSAHPNDASGVDAYLVFNPGYVWTYDE